ncbi:DUF3027 domain-containing protein [Actinokineospora auranticolor]|uniref:DUF3027 family protein n=1 Tax=Actinokineospora auranticolor TaxID=155976 RepID=A0A2S6GZC1_9PSEU|nr:DUF3027 domain-containing protein [Actinokineospora auranticolor]PPK70516.1 Protein of unknown function (DUF3027) [Actinokineospora auranticolor]
MTSTPAPEAATDPALIAAVEFARAAAREQAGTEVGAHVEVRAEDSASATHLFEADKTGYRGWRWAVTVAVSAPDTDVTVSEVVLLPGPDALVAPPWVPWQDRVRAGDLGVGDLLPTAPDDPRLVPAYLESDDPEVEELAMEVGLGRVRVLSRFGRLDAADRWQTGEFGPGSDMARGAPAACGTCGFYLPVAGAVGAAFGVCGNELAPADGRAVHAGYGCGAHSEAEVEQISPVLVADLIYDDAQLDVEATPLPEPVEGGRSDDSLATEADGPASVAAEADEPAADEPQSAVVAETEPDEVIEAAADQAEDALVQAELADEPSGQPESDQRG